MDTAHATGADRDPPVTTTRDHRDQPSIQVSTETGKAVRSDAKHRHQPREIHTVKHARRWDTPADQQER
jgi:hypothetical protein